MKKKKQSFKGLFLLSICFLSFIFLLYGEEKREINVKNSQLIGYADKKDLYVKSSKEKILSLLSNGTGVIFISNKDDDITKVFDVLYSCALLHDQVINYYDITLDERIVELDNEGFINVVKNSTTFYDKLLSSLGVFSEVYSVPNKDGELINTGYKKIYTPFVIFVKDGKVVYTHYVTDTNIDEETGNTLKQTYLKGFEILEN